MIGILMIAGAFDELMKESSISKKLRHKAIRVFLTGIVKSCAAYGLYLKHIKVDRKFIEEHPYSDIKGFTPMPMIFDDGVSYYLNGTDTIMVVEDGEKFFLRLSYNLDEEYITEMTLESLLPELPKDVGEIIIFNIDRF